MLRSCSLSKLLEQFLLEKILIIFIIIGLNIEIVRNFLYFLLKISKDKNDKKIKDNNYNVCFDCY